MDKFLIAVAVKASPTNQVATRIPIFVKGFLHRISQAFLKKIHTCSTLAAEERNVAAVKLRRAGVIRAIFMLFMKIEYFIFMHV